jgi:DNA-binding XRE family transcriptional regulator
VRLTERQKWEVRERVRLALRHYPEGADRRALRYGYTRKVMEIVTDRDNRGFPASAVAFRRWRKRNGYTQEHLATLLGMSASTLQAIEAGRQPYRLVYGMAVAWLATMINAAQLDEPGDPA